MPHLYVYNPLTIIAFDNIVVWIDAFSNFVLPVIIVLSVSDLLQ